MKGTHSSRACFDPYGEVPGAPYLREPTLEVSVKLVPSAIAGIAILAAASCGSSPSGPGSSGDGPVLTSPADGDTVAGPGVQFAWDAVSGATRYYHQLSTDSSMQGATQVETTTQGVSRNPGSTGRWWWRVRASVSGQSSYTDWSPAWSFLLQ